MSNKCEDCIIGLCSDLHGNVRESHLKNSIFSIRPHENFMKNDDFCDTKYDFCPECGHKIDWDKLDKSDKIP